MRSEKPLITIGIPFFNPEMLIIDAIKSVFAQTHQNWELILVDDGSKDNSLDLIAKINDYRVKLIADGANKGLVARLNQIIEISNGDFIARMDADDLMHPDRLNIQLNFLIKHPDIDLVDTGAIILNRNRIPVGIRGLEPYDFSSNSFEILKKGIILHASILARKEWYMQNRYDSIYTRAEDRELFVRTLHKSKFAHIPEPLYFYMYEGNVRLKAFLKSYQSERKVIKKYGPSLVGYTQTWWLYLRSCIKSAALIGLKLSCLDALVTKHSYNPISPQLLNYAQEILQQITSQQIPGLDELE